MLCTAEIARITTALMLSERWVGVADGGGETFSEVPYPLPRCAGTDSYINFGYFMSFPFLLFFVALQPFLIGALPAVVGPEPEFRLFANLLFEQLGVAVGGGIFGLDVELGRLRVEGDEN